MKDFLKMMFASMAGMVLFGILMGILLTMSIIGLVASSSQTANIEDNSVLTINLNNALEERSTEDIYANFMGNTGSIGLDELLNAIKKAKSNPKIKGIYLEGGLFQPDSYASVEAARRALVDFKKSGKWVIAYADTYTMSSYYLASAADKVLLNPSGMIEWKGMGGTQMYLKDFYAKFGVKMQVAKVGKYKSATEQFTETEMSEANREQVMAYLGGIWQTICTGVSQSRNVSVTKLNQYADNLITFDDPQNYVNYRLVDKLVYANDVRKEIQSIMKLPLDEEYNKVSLSEMNAQKEDLEDGDEIAVYYAFGDIVDNAELSNRFSSEHLIDAQKVTKDLDDLAEDEDVKAVVLRINSGGGSAYASEQIWHSIMNLKAKKPVVVSMGGMAASGGYYISAPASWIVAEKTTLTGSIGIFGVFPDFSGLMKDKLGIHFSEVKTNKNSTFGTLSRPFNAEESAILTAYIQRGYSLFRERVAQGRRMTTAQVEAIAQGHVWLGQDAIKIRLVDQLGSLDDAIKKAAQLAKLKDYYTETYPEEETLMQTLLKGFSNEEMLDSKLKDVLQEGYEPFMLLRDLRRENAVQARIPFVFKVE